MLHGGVLQKVDFIRLENLFLQIEFVVDGAFSPFGTKNMKDIHALKKCFSELDMYQGHQIVKVQIFLISG